MKRGFRSLIETRVTICTMQKAYRETRVIAIFAIKNAEQEEEEYSQEIIERRLHWQYFVYPKLCMQNIWS